MNSIPLKFKPSDRRVIWMWLLVQLALYLQVLQLSQLGRGLYLPVHRASKSLLLRIHWYPNPERPPPRLNIGFSASLSSLLIRPALRNLCAVISLCPLPNLS